MSLITGQPHKRVNEKASSESHKPDLIHELGYRLSCLWGYDRHINDAMGQPTLQEHWREVKSQEQLRIEQLKEQIEQQFLKNHF